MPINMAAYAYNKMPPTRDPTATAIPTDAIKICDALGAGKFLQILNK
jgi:hypothetical protein